MRISRLPLLVGVGEDSHAELFGHHLLNGFGTKRPDRATEGCETSRRPRLISRACQCRFRARSRTDFGDGMGWGRIRKNLTFRPCEGFAALLEAPPVRLWRNW
jgi:hypothetical protein